MEHRRVLLKRMLRMVLPMVILAGIIIGCSLVEITSIKPGYDSVHVKAQVTEILEDYSAGEAFTGNQKVVATITSGEYKAQSCELNNANAYQRGEYCVVGIKIIPDAVSSDYGIQFHYYRNFMWTLRNNRCHSDSSATGVCDNAGIEKEEI